MVATGQWPPGARQAAALDSCSGPPKNGEVDLSQRQPSERESRFSWPAEAARRLRRQFCRATGLGEGIGTVRWCRLGGPASQLCQAFLRAGEQLSGRIGGRGKDSLAGDPMTGGGCLLSGSKALEVGSRAGDWRRMRIPAAKRLRSMGMLADGRHQGRSLAPAF